jgi:hypothetical protein
MTYPDQQGTKVQSMGFFTAEGRDADKLRERIAAIGMEWFHDCKQQRNLQERQWYLNLAFYYGQQNVKFRTINGAFDLYVPKAPYYRVRMIINQIRKIIRKEISRLTAQKPNAFIVPSSTEDADVFAAQAGEQIWDSLWRRLHFNRVLREAVFWQATCGNAFIKTYWDKTKIDPDQPKQPDPMNPGKEIPIYGDICIDTVSPFHIFVPDLLQTDIEKQPYIIHAQVQNRSWVKQTFGIDMIDNELDSVDESMQNVMKVNRNDSKKNQVTILEIWVKPKYLPELPEGGVFIVAGNKLVSGFDQWPYEQDNYPFSKLDASLTGKFYTTSIVEDLIPLQQELNRSRSQLIESKNRMSKPQLVAEKGSVDAKRITTEPGQVIEYSLGHNAPQPLPLQNLPSYVTEEINRLYDDMADISGQHEVSNGSTPPGVTAATAISFLQEQDESLIATNYTSIEEAVEKIGTQCLMFVKMYWDEERTVKVVGIDGTFDVQVFKNADIRGNTDFRVESGSALPTSRAAKQAFIMDLMKMGFIPPDEGLEMMEIGGINRIYERIQIDKRSAQRENLKMRGLTAEIIQQSADAWMQNPQTQKDIDAGLQLNPPPVIAVHTWDNHDLHIQVHNDYRKSQNFEAASSEVKQQFEEHVRQHQEAGINMITHPLTGMDPNNPQAPNPEDEEAAQQQMDQENPQEDSQEGNPGPVPMPQTSSDQPQQGG